MTVDVDSSKLGNSTDSIEDRLVSAKRCACRSPFSYARHSCSPFSRRRYLRATNWMFEAQLAGREVLNRCVHESGGLATE